MASAPDTDLTSLVAACDALVLKALESVGKRLVRSDRARYRVLGTRPFHEAHCLWTAPAPLVDKALRSAWDVVPSLSSHANDIPNLTIVLDMYVKVVVDSQKPHDCNDLANVLGIALENAPYTQRRYQP